MDKNNNMSMTDSTPRKITQPQEFSFLNLSALNNSFLERSSSSSKDSSQSQSFDMSSGSNPYQISSESEEEVEEIVQSIHKSLEKSSKGVNILLSYYLQQEKNFPNLYESTAKLIKKLNLSKFELLIFYIYACVKDREDDVPVLFEKLKVEFFNQESSSDIKLNLMIYRLVEEQTRSDKGKACSVFCDYSAYFLQRVLEDKQAFFDLFLEIVQSGELNKSQFLNKLYIETSSLRFVLQSKKYQQILFLVNNNVKIVHTSMISFTQTDEFTYEGYLNKPLAKINFKLFAIFYSESQKDLNIIKKLLQDVRQSSFEYKELLKVFIKYRVNSLAKDTFRALTDCDYLFDTKILNFTLTSQNYEVLWFIANHESVPLGNWLNEEQTQKMLVEYLYTAEGKNFEYLLYYLKQIKRLKSKQTIRRLSETLINRLHSCRQGQFLYTFYNPLKISLLVVELMQQTIENVMHHKIRLNKALELYYKFAQIYVSLISDDSLVIELFKDTDLERRKVVFLIDKNKSAIISASQSVEDAVESMWNGNLAPKTNWLKMFTVTSNLFYSELSDYLIEKDPKKNEMFMILNTFFLNHHFSFQRIVWTYNCRIRNQIDSCITLILTLCIFVNFFFLFKSQQQIQEIININHYEYSVIEEQELQEFHNLKTEYKKFQLYIDVIIGVNFTFRPLFIIYYDWTQSVKTKFNIQDMTGIVLGGLSLFQLIFIYNATLVSEPYRFDILVTFRWVYITVTMLISIHCIKNFKLFGPMIKALWLVMLECSKLFFIFLLVNLLFGFMAYFSFYENINNRMSTLGNSLLFLVEALFGQFSFVDFDQPSEIFGPIFLNIYLFFSPIIFMQLIVAVLTFTFETASRSGRVNYYIGIIESIRNLEYDTVCGCLVTLPILGSFLNIIFFFVHLLSDPDPSFKEHNIDTLKKVNRVLVKISYYPIYLIVTLVSLVLVIGLSPVFYVVKLYRILSENNNRHVGSSKFKRFFKWLFLGFAYMAVQTYKDFVINYKYLMHGKFINDNQQINISNCAYSSVAAVSKDFYLKSRDRQNKVELIDFLQAVMKKIKFFEQKMANKMQKEDQIGQTLQSQSNFNLEKKQTQSSSREVTKQFTFMKTTTEHLSSKDILPIISTDRMNESQKLMKQTSFIDSDRKQSLKHQKPSPKQINQETKPLGIIKNNSQEQKQEKQGQAKISPKQIQNEGLTFSTQIESLTQRDNLKTENNKEDIAKQFKPKRVLFQGQQGSQNSMFSIKPIQVSIDNEFKHQYSPGKPKKSILLENENGENNDKKTKYDFKKIDLKDNFLRDDSPRFRMDDSTRHRGSHNRQSSIGSNIGKQSRKSYHLSFGGDFIHQRRKTSLQMWKKIRKEEEQNGTDSNNNILKDSDNLYQFLESFVIDEGEQNSQDTESGYSKNDKVENTNEYINIENLLKLMYHYSKNDVKLARFNILFQTIKKLLKGE